MSDARVEMAYDAIVARLSLQTDTLTNLRNRATGLLGIAALVASFSSGIGLINTDQTKGAVLPTWASWALLGVLIVIGLLVMAVLLPVQEWHYGPSAEKIMDRRDRGASEDDIRAYVITELNGGWRSNKKALEFRWTLYRLGASLLFVQLLILVSAVASR